MRLPLPGLFRIMLVAVAIAGASAAGSASAAGAAEVVKLSSSGICHASDSPWYDRTKKFTPYETLAGCLEHGRLPKAGRSGGGSAKSEEIALLPRHQGGGGTGSKAGGGSGDYRREAFGPGWLDGDGDCADSRAEKLAELSTVAVGWKGCRVVHGRWIDPYTGRVVLEAHDLDIDHIVPLAWAWAHGADGWSRERREAFANDPVNLLPVDAGANRAKGALGPDAWLPPAEGFRCEYVLRFTRIALGYGLLDAGAREAVAGVRARVCG